MPLVSVVVPAYNASAHIADTLDSTLAQTHAHTEVIVVDDGSTDGPSDVVARYADRIRCVRQSNAGVGAARNHGLRLARGDFIAFLDADDVWSPHMLETQLALLARYPRSGFVAANGVQIEENGDEGPALLWGDIADALRAAPEGIVHGRYHHEMIANNAITTVGQVLLPRRVMEDVGPFVEPRSQSEDWDLWLRVTARYPVTFHRRRLLRYRRTEVSTSGPAVIRHIRWAIRGAAVIRRHLPASPPEARVLFRRKLERAVGEAAREAYYLGRRVDVELGRRSLIDLWRALPTSTRIPLYLVALYLPEHSVSRLAQAMRSVTSAR
jgi:glycosyltransferase involved in cell wall biosynthesis